MSIRPYLLALLLMAASAPALASDSMRCGSRLVAVESIAAEVLAACGEPSFRDVFSYPGISGPGVIADEERWTYNFGPNQLLRVLKLRNGRVIDIESDGYGFAATPDRRCDSSDIAEGLSKYRLLQLCGEPYTRRNLGYVQGFKPRHRDRYGNVTRTRDNYLTEVYREEWVYNLGSRYLLRVVTLEDGVISDVQNGERGSDAR